MNSPSIDIKAMLAADPLVNTGNFSVHIGSEPPTPNNTITIYDTGGFPPALTYNKAERYEFPAVQIRVRAVDYTTGWQLIERIKKSLHGRAGELWGTAVYTLIQTAFGPFHLDMDSNQRMRFVINFNLQRKELLIAPSDISLSAATIAENNVTGAIIGVLSSTDANTGETFTYTLVSGTGSTDNASFTIEGTNLKAAIVFDYETKSSYSIRIRSTDTGGMYFEKVFTITVSNVNE